MTIYTTAEAAAFLRDDLKVRIKESTLVTFRTKGGGPQYLKVLGRVEYHEDDLRAWVDAERRVKFRNASQEHAYLTDGTLPGDVA